MGTRTDYTVLVIVATVALVAIVAMWSFPHTTRTQNAEEPLLLDEPDATPAPFTGAFIAEREERPVVPDTLIDTTDKRDYTGDGVIDDADAERLADAIDAQRCPYLKRCDLNNDGTLDLRDLGVLNTYLLEERAKDEANGAAQPSALVRNSRPVSRAATRFA